MQAFTKELADVNKNEGDSAFLKRESRLCRYRVQQIVSYPVKTKRHCHSAPPKNKKPRLPTELEDQMYPRNRVYKAKTKPFLPSVQKISQYVFEIPRQQTDRVRRWDEEMRQEEARLKKIEEQKARMHRFIFPEYYKNGKLAVKFNEAGCIVDSDYSSDYSMEFKAEKVGRMGYSKE